MDFLIDIWGKFTVQVAFAATNVNDVSVKLLQNIKDRQIRNNKEGLCPCCGIVQTHEIGKDRRKKNKRNPINNIMVYNGTCLRCALIWPFALTLSSTMTWKYLFTQDACWEKAVKYWIAMLNAALPWNKTLKGAR